MNEEAGFLDAIQKNPNDDVTRLAYADWLEERGDVRAEYLRLEYQRARINRRMNRLSKRIAPGWCGAMNWRRQVVGPPPINLLVIRSPDALRLARFYEALGLSFQRAQYVNDLPCFVANYGSTRLELQTVVRRAPTASLCFGIVVRSVDEGVRTALEHGGTLLTPAVTWSLIGRRAAVADPDGHRVELAESEFGRPTGDYPE
jgi:uncharacterized protein (TIGR02996 family)